MAVDFATFEDDLREHFTGDPLGRDLVRLFDAVQAKHDQEAAEKHADGRPVPAARKHERHES